MSNASNFYIVQPGDTLSGIAHSNRTTVGQLTRLNEIADPDRIRPGQWLALNPKAVCQVAFLLIDWDRNPIPGAKLRLEYCGKQKVVTTRANGESPSILTETTTDLVKVAIARPDGTWELIAQVVSGNRNQRVELKSRRFKIETETQPHPRDAAGNPVTDKKNPAPPVVPPPTPKATSAEGRPLANYGDGKGPKALERNTDWGNPVLRLSNDQADLSFLDNFNGEVLTDADYKWAAKELGVEEALIRAVAEVEGGGKGFTRLYGRLVPIIKYERHYFHRLTRGKFSASNSDVSWPYGYFSKNVRYVAGEVEVTVNTSNITLKCWRPKRSTDKTDPKTGSELLASGDVDEKTNFSGNVKLSYERLLKAYNLDPAAALMSSSWGAFQIMGENYDGMKLKSIQDLVKRNSRSEREQLHCFILFLRNVKPYLIKALREENLERFAKGYNGASCDNNNYAGNIKKHRDKWRLLCKSH